MRFRTTLVLLVLVLLAGAFFAFYTGSLPSDVEYEEQQRRVFAPAEFGAAGEPPGALMRRVTRVEIRRSDQTVRLERPGLSDPWRITAPTVTAADRTQVDDLLFALESLETIRTLRPAGSEPLQLAAYGLDQPECIVSFAIADRELALHVGAPSLDGNTCYLARPDRPGTVYVVSRATVARVTRSLAELRDRVLLRFDPSRLRTISVVLHSGPLFEIRREREGWRLTEPVDTEADTAAVENLLDPVPRTIIPAESVVADRPESLSRYGLDPPLVTLAIAEDGRTARLLTGAKAEDRPGYVYAMREGESCVFLLPESVVGSLMPSLRELRSKDAIAFAPEEVAAVEVRLPAQTVRLAREGTGWVSIVPASLVPDQERVQAFLASLRALKVVDWIDDATSDRLEQAGMSQPAAEVEMTLKGGGRRSIRFGRRIPERGLVFARQGDLGPLLLVSSESLDNLAMGDLLFRSRVVLRLRPSDVATVEITRPGAAIALAQRDGTWVLVRPTNGPADVGKIKELLDKLCYLECVKLVGTSSADLSPYGLDHAAFRVELGLESNGRRETRVLLVGGPVEGGAYAMLEGGSEVFVLPATVVEKVSAEFASLVVSSFNPLKVSALEISATEGTSVRLERRGTAWFATKPVMAEGATRAALEIIANLADLHASSIAAYDRDACDLAALGLSSPRATIRIEMEGGVARTLRIGTSDAQSSCIIAEDLPYVFRVEERYLRPAMAALERYGRVGNSTTPKE